MFTGGDELFFTPIAIKNSMRNRGSSKETKKKKLSFIEFLDKILHNYFIPCASYMLNIELNLSIEGNNTARRPFIDDLLQLGLIMRSLTLHICLEICCADEKDADVVQNFSLPCELVANYVHRPIDNKHHRQRSFMIHIQCTDVEGVDPSRTISLFSKWKTGIERLEEILTEVCIVKD